MIQEIKEQNNFWYYNLQDNLNQEEEFIIKFTRDVIYLVIKYLIGNRSLRNFLK